MKRYFLFIILLVSLSAVAQEKTFYGKVLDRDSNTPIQGVYLIVGRAPITFTDENGIFEFNANIQDERVILLSHLSYNPLSIDINKLTSDTNCIFLEKRYQLLSEITISSNKTRTIVKKAHKQFIKNHRPFSYWAQSNYKQLIRHQGKCRSYLETDGYAFMPEIDRLVFKGAPHIVPLHLRRSREDPILQQFCYVDRKKISLLLAPRIFESNCDEFAFFERIHPLGRFNFKDYVFQKDTIEKSIDNYVLIFKPKKNGFSAIGWWIHDIAGKIWIDKQTFNIKKISVVFNRDIIRFNQVQVDYSTIGGTIYPMNVEMKVAYNFFNQHKQREKLYAEFELTFQKIDNTPRANYMKQKNSHYYVIDTLIEDLDYEPEYWRGHKLDDKWRCCLSETSNAGLDNEFIKGAKQKARDKSCWRYKSYNEEYRENGRAFAQKMKTDLNLK